MTEQTRRRATRFLPAILKERAHELRAQLLWVRMKWPVPTPDPVKRAVMHRHGQPTGVWVETGTYLGTTTAFLAASAEHVYSIEPDPQLAARARARFARNDRVTIIEGLSEVELPALLPRLDGPVSFWLDGHYSFGITHKGPTDTPIQAELSAIEGHLLRFKDTTVLVDDFRIFVPDDPLYADYPTRSWLVGWADRNGLPWTVEYDIFVAGGRA